MATTSPTALADKLDRRALRLRHCDNCGEIFTHRTGGGDNCRHCRDDIAVNAGDVRWRDWRPWRDDIAADFFNGWNGRLPPL